jgi:hypothetical protein
VNRTAAALAVLLIASLAGCMPQPPDSSPSGPAASPSRSASEPRFLIECVDQNGAVIGTFTRLEEAWASTNYVRIDHCTASGAAGQAIELTPEEESVARTAAADLPDEGPANLFLLTLATCVRVAPTSQQGLSTLPTSLLHASLELCPDAPHAGLMEDELESRTSS